MQPIGGTPALSVHRARLKSWHVGIATAVALVATAGALFARAYASVPGVDRSAYVRGNLRLLAGLPAYPAATRVSLESAGWTLTREPLFAEYTAGYTTTARYDAPAGTRQDAVAAFYRRALAGWRAAAISHPVPTAARPAAPAIRCFARGVASVCVSIASFRDGRGRVTFAVLADSRAYESRPG